MSSFASFWRSPSRSAASLRAFSVMACLFCSGVGRLASSSSCRAFSSAKSFRARRSRRVSSSSSRCAFSCSNLLLIVRLTILFDVLSSQVAMVPSRVCTYSGRQRFRSDTAATQPRLLSIDRPRREEFHTPVLKDRAQGSVRLTLSFWRNFSSLSS